MGRGINLGDALESRSEPPGLLVSEDVIGDVVAAGFDTVRVPVRWSAHADAEQPWTIEPGFAAAVDRVVQLALVAGLQVVLNVHHYDEINQDPAGHSDRLAGLWRQIAQRYRRHPAALRFELLNEPRAALDPARWNELSRAALAGLRSVDVERQVLVGPALANSVAGLPELELPDDDQLAVTIHYYDPMRFTHQGASWEPGAAHWLGTRWQPATGAHHVTRDLEFAANWAAERGRPLFLGEFGTFEECPQEDRRQWTRWVRAEAERLGIEWCYWDLATDFGVYDPHRRSWNRPLLDALIPP